MKRTLVFLYGIISYVIFFAVFLYAIGFVGGLLVPQTVDTAVEAPLAQAILINTILLGLFAVQHTIMARQSFKHWLTRILPKAAERSTFVLVTSLLLALIFWQWRSVPAIVWDISHPVGVTVMWLLFVMGWVLVLLSTFLTSHADLFGVRQTYYYWLNKEYHPIAFKKSLFYKWVRHPLLLGFIIAFWATPTMTVGHLLFAGLTTGYTLIGIQFEERDLIRIHGDDYKQYKKSTPMLIPRIWRIHQNSGN